MRMFRQLSCIKELMKIHVKTFGCSLNKAESEMLIDRLIRLGYKITDREEDADLIILNTCGVKTPTENKVINIARKISKVKPIIIGGCLPKISLKRILKSVNNTLAILGTQMYNSIEEVLERIKNGETGIIKLENKLGFLVKEFTFNPIVGIVPIATGCVGNCTYCCVKIARGRIKSRNLDEIIQQVRLNVSQGCKEIWLTAQDTASYGLDAEVNLPALVNAVSKVRGEFKIRIGMMNPSTLLPILDDLINAYRSRKVYKFIHIPVQSGSDKILKRMGRRYKTADFIKIVNKFREVYPKITLATDIIVGFPGETDRDFENTINLLRTVQPDIVNISRFGVRPGAEAEKFEDQVEDRIKKRRSRILSTLVHEIGLTRNLNWMSWKGNVLISEKGVKGGWIGRNYTYKPVLIKCEEKLLGRVVKVRITDVRPQYLIGEILAKI